MTNEEFEKIIQERISDTLRRLIVKGKEYGSTDRLHNFKRAAQVLGCTPERALVGFKTKHTVSLLDIIDGIDKGKNPSREMWDEKIGDEIAYCLLLDAVVSERLKV